MDLTATRSSTADRARRYRRYLFGILAFALFQSGCIAGAATHSDTELTFDRHEVVLGSAERQTVLTGFFLGGSVAELAVVNIDENDDRRLRVYVSGNGTWAPQFDATLRPEVMFVDVANIGGRDRLITYEPGRLNWFNPESARDHALASVHCNFVPPHRGEIPHVDITRDVNSDGRDDLVLPDADGFWVYIQMSDGAFADPVKIGPPFEMASVYEPHGYRYNPWDQSRIHKMDYNRDGRSDLVYWNEGHFEAHLQDARGLIGTAAKTFTTDVSFDSDDLTSLAAPHNISRPSPGHNPSGDMTGRVLHSMADQNGDGIADLGIFSLEGGSLSKMHSAYEIHFGTPASDGSTMFAPEVSTAARSDGIPLAIPERNLVGDGRIVMMFKTFKIGFFKIVGAILSHSTHFDLEIYGMQGGIYSDKPSATFKIDYYALGVSGEKAAMHPAVMIGDVNGDRYSDLLVGRNREELHVFPGVPGTELFARQPQIVTIAMASEKYTWLVDLNKDDKQDVLMHHASATEPHRVSLLFAR